jgi:hypothetical protein
MIVGELLMNGLRCVGRCCLVKLLAVVAIHFALQAGSACAQSVFSNTITGSNPSASNPYTTGQVVNTNLTASGIGRGTGIVAENGGNVYNASSWNTASLDTTAYFTWTMTPTLGQRLSLTSLVYTASKQGNGPTAFAFRSSLDAFTTDIGTAVEAGGTISLSGPAYQNLVSSVEFRLYAWNASTANGTYSVDDFTYNGNVTPIPEPTTILSLYAGTLALGAWLRRRFVAPVVA